MAIEMIDLFYVDVKIMNKSLRRSIEKGDIELLLSNLDMLMNSQKSVIIWVLVIGNYTDGIENRHAVKDLLEKYKDRILKIGLINEHSLGESKYTLLNLEMHYNGVSDELMEKYK